VEGVPGRELAGIHFAMDYLYQRNRWVAEQEGRPSRPPEPGTEITAAGKRVLVIGGGDTGMDCISNAAPRGRQEHDHARRLPGAGARTDAMRCTHGRSRPSGR
jgi:glutamate synthase (NADPH/NADH) small chain